MERPREFELGWPRLDPAGSRKPTLLSTSARSAETRARRPPSTTWRGRGPVQDRRRADARLRLPGRRDGRSRDASRRRRQRCGGATIAAGVAKSMRGVLHAYRWADDAMIDVVGSPSSLWTEVPMGSTTRVDRWRAGWPRVPLQERRNAGSWNVARRQGEPGSWHQRLGPGHRRDLGHRALQRPDPGLSPGGRQESHVRAHLHDPPMSADSRIG